MFTYGKVQVSYSTVRFSSNAVRFRSRKALRIRSHTVVFDNDALRQTHQEEFRVAYIAVRCLNVYKGAQYTTFEGEVIELKAAVFPSHVGSA